MDLNESKTIAMSLDEPLKTIGFIREAEPQAKNLGIKQVELSDAHQFEIQMTFIRDQRDSISCTLTLSMGTKPGGANTVQLEMEASRNGEKCGELIPAYRSDSGHEARSHREILASIMQENGLEQLKSAFTD